MQRTSTMTARAVLLGAAFCFALAPLAKACPADSPSAKLNALKAAANLKPDARGQSAAENPNGNTNQSAVGMWIVTMSNNGSLFDFAFQQLHSDGLEMQNSGVAPPVTGAVCWGVWQHISGQTYKIKHFGWVFGFDNSFYGTYVLTATITLSKDGNSYGGSYVADIVLPDGTPDPAAHGAGPITGTRVTVE